MIRRCIKVPKTLDLRNSLDFSCVLATEPSADRFEFDFSSLNFVEPFGMMLVSSEIQRLITRNKSAEFLCQNFRHLRYAGHMGFFKAFGLDFGKSPGEASGGTSYVPMTLLDCDRLRQRAAEDGAHVGDIVESESKHLAAILCTGSTGAVYDTLSYSIREIMRNVVEHSKANQIAFCAQHWPSKQRVEVAVVDRGVGLAATLKRNPHLDIQSDKHAVNYALMPAVSGIAFKGAKRREKSHWANSGFGLYMTSRICRNGGNFFIASGDTGMILTKKAKERAISSAVLRARQSD